MSHGWLKIGKTNCSGFSAGGESVVGQFDKDNDRIPAIDPSINGSALLKSIQQKVICGCFPSMLSQQFWELGSSQLIARQIIFGATVWVNSILFADK